MSERLDLAAAALREKIEGSGFQGSVGFDMGEDGFIRVQDEEVSLESGPTDCTITAPMDVFREMFEGNLDPTKAFMTGRLRIDGSMGVAMQLARVL